jgi:hypothetical protein
MHQCIATRWQHQKLPQVTAYVLTLRAPLHPANRLAPHTLSSAQSETAYYTQILHLPPLAPLQYSDSCIHMLCSTHHHIGTCTLQQQQQGDTIANL